MRRVYIVLSTISIGGAEKRFTDIWCALREQGHDVHLVMDPRTRAALGQQRQYRSVLVNQPRLHLIDLGRAKYPDFVRAIWNFFSTQPPRAVIHYPLAFAPIVQARYGHRLVVSWVDSSFPPLRLGRLKYSLTAWAAFVSARRIDVLNPNNLQRLRRFGTLGRKATLTAGGTHIDSTLYRPRDKALDLVFLGRVEPEKQSLRFVLALPEIHRTLQAFGLRGYRFVLCGDGPEAAAVADAARSAAFADVPFTFGFTAEPETVLGRAAVFFSLQRTSNYPSKALAEAMACGAFPIVTDAGESRLMVEGCPHYAFVPVEFTAADITTAMIPYLQLDAARRERVATELAEYAHRRFTIATQASYFASLYEEVSAP
jgi:glycosyltransferase involved in cell wall biosynthesis